MQFKEHPFAFEKEFEAVINTVFPDSQKVFVSNFDDIFYGWNVGLKPGTVLKIKVGFREDQTMVQIISFVTHLSDYSDVVDVTRKNIYRGSIEKDEKFPDWFFETILGNGNWERFG